MGLPLLDGIKEGLQSVTGLIDSLHTSEEEKQQLKLCFKEVEVRMAEAQTKINEKEAVHRSLWVAGWRPFIGWSCGAGLAHHLLIWPYVRIIWENAPAIDVGTAVTMLGGMLGFGAFRSYEKRKGLAK